MPSSPSDPPTSLTTKVRQPQLDVIVADAGIGSILAGYLLADRGRTVGIVDRPAETGSTTAALTAARQVTALEELVHRSPVIARRSVVVLQPEGAMTVSVATDRLEDKANGIAVIDRSQVADLLVDAIHDRGGVVLPGDVAPEIDESGRVRRVRRADGSSISGRCSILSDVDVDRLVGMLPDTPSLPATAMETEWVFELDRGSVDARFSLKDGTAAESWLYGDPLDGAGGFGRLRAFGNTVTLAVVLPLSAVLNHRVEVADLGRRLRAHPTLAPLLAGAAEVGVSGRTLSLNLPDVGLSVGDGWAVVARGLPGDIAPLSTQIAFAEAAADVIDTALDSAHVSAARLAGLPQRLRATQAASRTLPFEPVDSWADEFVVNPTRLVDAARLLAERFGPAR